MDESTPSAAAVIRPLLPELFAAPRRPPPRLPARAALPAQPGPGAGLVVRLWPPHHHRGAAGPGPGRRRLDGLVSPLQPPARRLRPAVRAACWRETLEPRGRRTPYLVGLDATQIPRHSRTMPGTSWLRHLGTAIFAAAACTGRSASCIWPGCRCPRRRATAGRCRCASMPAFPAKAVPAPGHPPQKEWEAGLAALIWLRAGPGCGGASGAADPGPGRWQLRHRRAVGGLAGAGGAAGALCQEPGALRPAPAPVRTAAAWAPPRCTARACPAPMPGWR